MKCNRCEKNAVIRLRQHRLIFCREHYLEWFLGQTEVNIDRYHLFEKTSRVLVTVSGGKDSLSLWHALNALGYKTHGVYINLGIDADTSYSLKSEQFTRNFAGRAGLPLSVLDLKSRIGFTIPELAFAKRYSRMRPCSACGLVKRHFMNRLAGEGSFDVVVTGHNLDDEAAVLFGNLLNWDTALLGRQAPLLEEQAGFVRKAKPFCRFTERETTAYAILQQIDYIEDECPYSVNAKQLKYKAILNELEETQTGVKLRFYSTYLKARKAGFFSSSGKQSSNEPIMLCPDCGQPTSSEGLCAFCRLLAHASNPRHE